MPTKQEILSAMEFPHMAAQPAMHTSSEDRLQLTFQFAEGTQPGDLPGGIDYGTWTSLTEDQRQVFRDALDHIETFLNVEFVEVSGNADPDLNVGQPDLQSAIGYDIPWWTAGLGGYWLSGTGDWDGYVLFDESLDITTNVNIVLHEMGHALGLDHPFENVTLDDAYTNNHYSVMAYDVDPESLTYNSAMMLYDVFAAQDIWGAADYNTGDTTYTGPRTLDVDVIWDTHGTDDLDASARSNSVSLDLREGAFSQFGKFEDVAIAFGVEIENARGGSGSDTITGNDLANLLFGGDGSDAITGGRGADRLGGEGDGDLLSGEAGRDKLFGGDGNDALLGGGGRDKLFGQAGDDLLEGGGGRDRLIGGAGDDMLAGGGGTDRLKGGADSDTFHFIPGADRDVVCDFDDDVDSLLIDGFGPLSEVMDAAEVRHGNTIFTFGDDVLVVRNITLDALTDDLIVA